MGPDLVTAYADTVAQVVETVAACDLGARVPACPDWSSYDVVVHLGNVHAWAATVVETRRRTERLDDHPRSRRPPAVAAWYAGKAEDLLQVLRSTPPELECWTFAPTDRTVGFWRRRQTHEAVVHLSDVRQASGRTTDVPADLAADGVAEVLEVFLPRMHARGRPANLGAPVLLHAEDTGDTWLVTPTGGAGPPRAEHVSGTDLVDADVDLVTGPAADLMLLLWKRLDVDAAGVTLDGDRERLRAFLGSPLTP